MQKGSAQILLILAALIITVISGVYFYQGNNKNSNSLPTPKFTISQEPEFKDYSNQQLGFSFTYAKNFSVQEDSEEEFNKRGNGNFRKNFTSYVTYQPANVLGAVVVLDETGSFEINPFTVWVFDNPDELSIEKWHHDYWYYPFVWGDYTIRRNSVAPTQDATISGQIAKSGIVTYRPGEPKFVYAFYSSKMFLFKVVGEEGDKILESFKFSQ